MRYGSICSGVEAATLAWEPLGWQPAFFAEVEPFPSEVLRQKFGATRPLRPLDPAEATSLCDRKQRKNWVSYLAKMPEGGTIRNLGDFTRIEKEDYDGDIDLLIGGTFCQAYSIAGLRKGLADPRGNLALEFARLAFRTGAKWTLWENVPGVLSSNGGKDFAAFLSLLCGWEVEVPVVGYAKGEPVRRWFNSGIITGVPGCYGLAWRIIDAQYARVDGFSRAVPQRRRRLFLIGCAGGWERAAAVLFEPPELLGHTPPQRQTGTGVARNLTASLGGASGKEQQFTFIDDQGQPLNALCMAHGQGGAEVMADHAPTLSCNHEAPIICRESGQGFWQQDQASGTVKVNGAEPTTVVCYDARGMGNGEISPNITGDHASRTNDYLPVVVEGKEAFGFLPKQSAEAGSIGFKKELAPTLRGSCDSYGICCFTQNDAGRDCADNIAPTLRSGGIDGGAINPAIASHGTVRRLTPVEAERLMGFRDNHTLIEWKGKALSECPDGPRYKACGNSMAVNCMRWLGMRIQMVEDFCHE